MDAIIEMDRVFKRFGNIVALNGVTFKVAKGQVFGYLGFGHGNLNRTETIRNLRACRKALSRLS